MASEERNNIGGLIQGLVHLYNEGDGFFGRNRFGKLWRHSAFQFSDTTPFNPSTAIGYYVPERSRLQLGVYNVKGSEFAVLVDEYQAEGAYRVHWNGRYSDGAEAASGVYFYRLRAGKKMLTRKMILLR